MLPQDLTDAINILDLDGQEHAHTVLGRCDSIRLDKLGGASELEQVDHHPREAENKRGFVLVNDRSIEHPLVRSEEHTSELQSRGHLVCRLLLKKKNKDCI